MYSAFIQVFKLNSLRSIAVIYALKQIFCVHGIPCKITTYCGSQFTSADVEEYGIQNRTVSPHHQSANAKAELSVQIVKKLWSMCEDKYLVIIDYITTPLENIKASPAQLLMGRRPRNLLLAVKELYERKTIINKEKFCKQCDRKAWTLEPLENHTPVRLQPTSRSKVCTPARIKGKLGSRPYAVTSEDGTFRRNRRQIIRSTWQAN
ncbi:integrase core domain [Elysia marginata]|uniref:Integrase core domain n=1 Tax=Elysia marginata TaxID=1093978 RepID=A0AAV4GGE6_9GAST|nr:integrase core domain [Elysia marginata]